MTIEGVFKSKEYPFLLRQIDEFKSLDKSITVTNNSPLMATVLIKLKPFINNNIKLLVGADKEFYDKQVFEYLKKKKILISFNKNQISLGDFFLDCGGDLINKGNPKAIAELTQTGSKKYEKLNSLYPIVSIDESRVKLLEDYYGTADGFLRAIKKVVTADLKGKHFIIMGYGKVGKGIARLLNQEKASITAIDLDLQKNQYFAKEQNVELVHVDEIDKIIKVIERGFCLVTCTGIKGLVSKMPFHEKILSSSLVLANMGAEDEYGAKFPSNRVLNNKFAANFLLDFPTQLKYLDPVFYAHNLCVQLYQENKLTKGFQKFPADLSDEILLDWSKYWQEDISDIYKL